MLHSNLRMIHFGKSAHSACTKHSIARSATVKDKKDIFGKSNPVGMNLTLQVRCQYPTLERKGLSWAHTRDKFLHRPFSPQESHLYLSRSEAARVRNARFSTTLGQLGRQIL